MEGIREEIVEIRKEVMELKVAFARMEEREIAADKHRASMAVKVNELHSILTDTKAVKRAGILVVTLVAGALAWWADVGRLFR